MTSEENNAGTKTDNGDEDDDNESYAKTEKSFSWVKGSEILLVSFGIAIIERFRDIEIYKIPIERIVSDHVELELLYYCAFVLAKRLFEPGEPLESAYNGGIMPMTCQWHAILVSSHVIQTDATCPWIEKLVTVYYCSM